jgi:hypothetical protein
LTSPNEIAPDQIARGIVLALRTLCAEIGLTVDLVQLLPDRGPGQLPTPNDAREPIPQGTPSVAPVLGVEEVRERGRGARNDDELA